MNKRLVRLLSLSAGALILAACSKTHSAAEAAPSGQPASAAPAPSPTPASNACAGTPDIAGLCLGMPRDAAIAQLTSLAAGGGVATNSGTLKYGEFESQPMTFSSSPSSGPEGNTRVVFGLPDGHVLYMQRQKVFDPQTATTFANLTATLTAKFGKPDLVVTSTDPNFPHETIYWTHGFPGGVTQAAIQDGSSDASLCLQGLGVGASGQGFLSDYFWGSMATAPNAVYQRCGTWTVIDISPVSGDNNLAGQYFFRSGNLSAAYQAYNTVLSEMQAGAAKADAQAANRAPSL